MYEKMEVRVVCLMVSSVDTERVLSEGWRWREVIHRLLEQASYSHLLIDGAMGVKIKQQIFWWLNYKHLGPVSRSQFIFIPSVSRTACPLSGNTNAFRLYNAIRQKQPMERTHHQPSCLALLLILLLLFTATCGRRLAAHHSRHVRHSWNLRHPRHTLQVLHLRHSVLERVVANAAATICGRVYGEDLADFPTSGGLGSSGEFLGSGETSDSQAVG